MAAFWAKSWSRVLGLVMLWAATTAHAQSPTALSFTQAQATRGQAAFATGCAACHGPSLQGGPGGPPLVGGQFRGHWLPKPGDALFSFVREKMPPGSAGALGDPTYADIVAYLLKANGAVAGSAALPADPARLAPLSLAATLPLAPKDAVYTRPDIDQSEIPPDAIAVAAEAARVGFLRKITPVTDDMLRHPPAEEWLNWRGGYDAHGFSKLAQINRDNVDKLQPAWAWQLGPGDNEVDPLVHDGVLFVVSGGRLEALNAATGDALWRYVHPGSNSTIRSLAIYGDLLYYAAETSMLALDVHTGKVVWERSFAGPDDGLRFSAGPIVAKGKLFQGMTNCSAAYPGGCFLLGLDAATGKELWRFNTIARPGQPGGDTWNGAPVEGRFGGSIWTAGSYDPDLDLIYFGAAQTYKTSGLISAKGRAAGLYTDTTLALRPDTGELVWYYQHLPGDVWDLDWAFERTLATIKVKGVMRRTVTTAGKMALFDTLDAATGQYLFSIDMGLQTLVTAIDPKTGAKTVDPRFTPEANVVKTICPGSIGARNWPATAYNPASGLLFVPLNETCMDFVWSPIPGPGGGWDWNRRLRHRAGSDGMVGRVQAVELATGRTVWTNRERSPHVSAILATAGGLVFEGSRDRWFRALDDRTGKVLWQTRLEAPPSSFPITYSIDGVQYVAVTAGGGNPADTYPGVMTPEIVAPVGQPTLMVFRLPSTK
jgi:alcohol dehydrogenase (cytochrome c)